MSTPEPLTEQAVRKLRDAVLEHPISDKEWNTCRDNWMRPDDIKWLLEQRSKTLKKSK
jgi:hypothetical protein